jgi:hypothetical protein
MNYIKRYIDFDNYEKENKFSGLKFVFKDMTNSDILTYLSPNTRVICTFNDQFGKLITREGIIVEYSYGIVLTISFKYFNGHDGMGKELCSKNCWNFSKETDFSLEIEIV